ncbi:MAG: hypothetical protein QOF48_2745 [Verrucomicrobiota bacterium]
MESAEVGFPQKGLFRSGDAVRSSRGISTLRPSGHWRDVRQGRLGCQAGGRVMRRLLFAALDGIVNFLPVHRQFRRRLDAQFNGVAIDAQDFHDDVTVNDDALVYLAREDEHRVW